MLVVVLVNIFKKVKSFYFAVSIFYIIIGLIMLLNPEFIANFINYVIGSIILVYGIVYLIKLYQQKNGEVIKFDFLAGVFLLSLGLYLVLNSNILLTLIPFCSGFIIILDGVYQLINSFKLKKNNYHLWYINLIIGLLFIGFAVYIMINYLNISYLIIRIVGGVLIFDALTDFYTYFVMKKNKKMNEIKVIEADVDTE